MPYFVTILTDTCELNHHIYIINTSVYKFTYRTEVFKNGNLIDKKEETSNDTDDTSFQIKYKQAHKDLRSKYCTLHTKTNNNINKTFARKLKKEKNYIQKNILKKLLIAIVSIVTLFFLFRTFVIYSDLYINTFYTTPKDKIIYLEKIEPKTHQILKKCLNVLKKEKLNDNIYTLEQCNLWCISGTIPKDSCRLLNAYKLSNYKNAITLKENTTVDSNFTLHYVIFPQDDLVFKHDKNSTIQINNLSPYSIDVSVKKILLNHSDYEEIIQFRRAISTLHLNENESKQLILFLESTYYEQFKKGLYEGHIEFSIRYQDKQSSFIKKFSFMVK